MQDDWVALEPMAGIEDMIERLMLHEDKCIGWCLVCDQPIADENCLILGTGIHACPKNLEQHAQKPFGRPEEV
jgi:hypothetical protein